MKLMGLYISITAVFRRVPEASLRFTITTAFLLLLLFECAAFTTPEDDPQFEVSATKFLLGTKVDILARHSSIGEARKACYFAFREIERIERLLSTHNESSEISKINKCAGEMPVKVSLETFAILHRAVGYSQRFDGFFDITIGPLTELWGFNSEREIAFPDLDRLAAAKNLVDFRKIALSEQDTTVFLAEKDMALDLGGIAKGYAIDRAAAVLKNKGVDHFLINAGGDIYASGKKAIHRKWKVGIKHPRKPNDLFTKLELQNYAIATSGDYERFSIIDGKRFHHILNPKTGFPADLCRSVTVLASTAEEADVWATFLFILGYQNFQERFKQNAVRAIFVDAKGEVYFDTALRKEFDLELLQ